MPTRKVPEINASSMADLAFLLLVFFLVTSTIESDFGLLRKLPPNIDGDSSPIAERNVLNLHLNSKNELLVQGEQMPIEELRKFAISFLENRENREDWPAKKTKVIPLVGEVAVSKQVVSLQNDKSTSYKAYVQVQNELAAAYTALRNDASERYFGKSYEALVDSRDQDKIKAIRAIYPMRISEAEPYNREGGQR